MGYDRALEQLLAKHSGAVVRIRSFGPKAARLGRAELADYPHAGARTWVTVGMARHQRSSWRGAPLGYELVLTLAAPDAEVVGMLEQAALEARRRGLGQVDRRSMIEQNGAWGPGYPPHLVFTDPSVVPELMGKHKLGDRYVRFLAAVPVDDREMRLYDQDPAGFIRSLSASDRTRYPRN